MAKHIIRYTEKEQAEKRLFCFPFAGGSAAAYRSWDQLLKPDVELCAVEIPGRVYMRQTAVQNMDALVDAIYPQILELLDRPFIFFAHSYGSAIAYEVTKRLQKEGKPLPLHLFVSSRRPPHFTDTRPQSVDLSDEEFIDVMQNIYHAIPDVVLNEPDLLKMTLPIFREDIRINEIYQGELSPLLKVPVTLFHGKEDRSEELDRLQKWEETTAEPFRIQSFEGSHFFIDSAKEEVIKTILEKF